MKYQWRQYNKAAALIIYLNIGINYKSSEIISKLKISLQRSMQLNACVRRENAPASQMRIFLKRALAVCNEHNAGRICHLAMSVKVMAMLTASRYQATMSPSRPWLFLARHAKANEGAASAKAHASSPSQACARRHVARNAEIYIIWLLHSYLALACVHFCEGASR